jgi:hypothetical protein
MTRKLYQGNDDLFITFIQVLSARTFNIYRRPNLAESNKLGLEKEALADFAAYWNLLEPGFVSLP